MRRVLRNIFGRYFDRWRWHVIAKWLEGDILDLGCGSGGLYSYVNKDNVGRYLGVDISDMRKTKKFEFLEMDIEIGAKESIKGSFNRVVLSACIEHLRQPEDILKWCRTVLYPDGFLVLTTPTPLGQKLLKFIFAGGSEHTKIFSKAELMRVLQSTGFNIVYYETFQLGANQLVIASRR